MCSAKNFFLIYKLKQWLPQNECFKATSFSLMILLWGSNVCGGTKEEAKDNKKTRTKERNSFSAADYHMKRN